VEGSNQAGVMVTCQAMTASPAGGGGPATAGLAPRIKEAAVNNQTLGRREGVIHEVRDRGMCSSGLFGTG
jgi:hypothetical protein